MPSVPALHTRNEGAVEFTVDECLPHDANGMLFNKRSKSNNRKRRARATAGPELMEVFHDPANCLSGQIKDSPYALSVPAWFD
ncbi:MAG: hypothetical protein Q9206_006015 [Seirophora lacunosa]